MIHSPLSPTHPDGAWRTRSRGDHRNPYATKIVFYFQYLIKITCRVEPADPGVFCRRAADFAGAPVPAPASTAP
jgi:hypothetical protein